jgi:ketosteroid isomerase-like protein
VVSSGTARAQTLLYRPLETATMSEPPGEMVKRMKRFLVPLFALLLPLSGPAAEKEVDLTKPGAEKDIPFTPADEATTKSVKTFLFQFQKLYNYHQAEAVAELFMDNGTWNTPQGEFTGPEAIKKRMDDFDFEHWHARDEVITTEKVGTFGALTYASGTWTNVVSEDGGKPIDLHGIWSVLLLPDGSGSWQILLNNYKILQYER